MPDPELELGRRTWTDITAAENPPFLVVPIGSCEQHGPHLPLDTDTRIAVALAEALAAVRSDVLVVPPLAITASGEHQGFPGTLSIGTAALRTVTVELIRSADWSRGVVLVNGHGGNMSAVELAVQQCLDDGRRVLNWWPRIPTAAGSQADSHAGRTETSLMLAICPTLVRTAAAVAGNTAPISAIIDRLRAQGVAAVSGNGVLGDPSGATADEGRRLLEGLAADLVARFDAWRR